MKIMILKYYILVTFICWLTGWCNLLSAQTICTQELRKAENMYDEGDLHQVPGILESCLSKGFTYQEEIQAYRLLTLTYLYLDDSVKADEAFLKLLRLQKDHQVNPGIDPAELVYLYKTFRTKPVFYINSQIGTNLSSVQMINRFGVENTSSDYVTYPYQMKFGAQVSAGIDVPVIHNFLLMTGLRFALRRFEFINYPFKFPEPFQQVRQKESQFWIDIPFAIKYAARAGKYLPYVFAGVSPQLLIASSGDIIAAPYGKLDKAQNPVTGPNISLSNEGLRNRFNISGMAGAGVRYKVGINYIGMEATFLYGFTNLVNRKNRYNNSLIFDYHYVDNDFSINSLSFSFNYIQSIYNPKKLTKKRRLFL